MLEEDREGLLRRQEKCFPPDSQHCLARGEGTGELGKGGEVSLGRPCRGWPSTPGRRIKSCQASVDADGRMFPGTVTKISARAGHRGRHKSHQKAADAQCGAGATCKAVSGTGVCTYDSKVDPEAVIYIDANVVPILVFPIQGPFFLKCPGICKCKS